MEYVTLPDYMIKAPSTITVCGPSLSGKTTFVFRLLKFQEEMFSTKPEQIIYCYKEFNPIFDQTEIKNIEFYSGMPDRETLQNWIDRMNGRFFVLVLDDLMHNISSNSMSLELTTTLVHHNQICLVQILQNIFAQGKFSRTNSLNTHYFCITRNCRDRRQIQVLGSQIFGGKKSKEFYDIYSDAVDGNHSITTKSKGLPYLFISCHPTETTQNCQLFTSIFPDDEHKILYRL